MRNMPNAPEDPAQLRAIIEALVFAAEEPLTIADLRDLFPRVEEETLLSALGRLSDEYHTGGRGLQVKQVAGGYRLTTRSELGEWVRALFQSRNRRRLSSAALETLAIVAYRQPITTPEIQALRGTDPAGVLQNLLDKKLLRVVGRKKVVGKPILYATTRDFLTHFGLNSLEDLPSLEEFGEMAAALGAGTAPLPDPPAPVATKPFEEHEAGNGASGDEGFEDATDEENENEPQETDGDDS